MNLLGDPEGRAGILVGADNTEDNMGSGIKIDATVFDKFGVRVRSLIKPEMPVKFEKNSITVGVPIIGSVCLYWKV